MKNPDINKLRDHEQKLRYRINAIQRRIEKIEENVTIPDLKEKYLGKYFKYLNSYSCPESDADTWWVYHHVVKIDNTRTATCNTFQVEIHEGINIKQKDDVYFNMLETECSKDEFDGNLKSTILKLKKFIK